jgi:hypothetical protein
LESKRQRARSTSTRTGAADARVTAARTRQELVRGRRYSTTEGAIAQVSTCLNSCLTGVQIWDVHRESLSLADTATCWRQTQLD